MSGTLDGATTPGNDAAYPADPGEFAARWNEWTESDRAAFLRNSIENSLAAFRCMVNHRETPMEQGTRIAHLLGMTDATVNGVPIPDPVPTSPGADT